MITILAAVGKNGVIGNNNQLIWHLPNDLKRFKQRTLGHPIIMGRKTFESFPKPLPGRVHFVISRQEHPSTENVYWVNSLQEAIQLAMTFSQEVFVIGGGEIYTQALPLADRMELTLVGATFEGDSYFPKIDFSQWNVISEEGHLKDEKHPYDYTFITLERKKEIDEDE